MKGSARFSTRVRLCRFELLEPRQVLSATIGDLLMTPHLDLKPHATASPVGFTPAQIAKGYGFTNLLLPGGVVGDGKGQTVAIVDAFNNPTIINDVKAFSTQFGLPQFNVAGGPTFKVVNQRGSTILPANATGVNFTWAAEIALDVEWVHAIAPRANILLVEATTNSFFDLSTALLYARSAPGVTVVSNSYGGSEFFGQTFFDSYYTTPAGHVGVSFVVSAGDNGTPAEYPSSSPNVLSVGGTSLHLTNTNNYSSEIVWANTTGAGGGGASLVENVPNYQLALGLSTRGTPDVSYNSDPSTGVPVYSSFAFGATTPWDEGGGTSAAAPQWAALIAIANQGRAILGKNSLVNPQAVMYKLPASDFHDITSGNNGAAASAGYDLATGLGTPIANLVVRDLINFNGSVLLPSNRAPAVGGSNGNWYFFAKPALAGGEDAGAGTGDNLAAANGDAGNSPAMPQATAGDASGLLAVSQSDAPSVSRSQFLPITMSAGDLWKLRRSGPRHHAAADEAVATLDMGLAKI